MVQFTLPSRAHPFGGGMLHDITKTRNIAIVIVLFACLPSCLSLDALGSDLMHYLAEEPPSKFFPLADRLKKICRDIEPFSCQNGI